MEQLREPCACAAGRICAVCRAYARVTPQPTQTRAQVRGGTLSKLGQLRARLPEEEARLAALRRYPLETQAEWGRRRKRQYDTCQRVRSAITALEARLTAWETEA